MSTTNIETTGIELHHNNKLTAKVENTLGLMLTTLSHSAEWPTEFFEQHLNCKRNTARFGGMIHTLKLELESRGYHLTSRGKNCTSFWVDKVEHTSRIVSKMNRKALSYLKRSVILAHSTASQHADKLTEEQRRKLEHQSRVQALRLLGASRMR